MFGFRRPEASTPRSYKRRRSGRGPLSRVQRAFMVYHPLHSILNASLHKAGLSWEAAYDAIRVVGAAFLIMAIAYWLLKLWSPGPAGVSLGLLSFMLLPDYGVHWIIPSNLALGIAIFVWARIFATNGAAEKSLIFGIPL